MRTVPKAFAALMATDAPLFTTRSWHHVHGLLMGGLLAPGQRTVSAALRVMGLAHAQSFQQSHRVLHRTVWARLQGARLLRRRLVALRAPSGPLVRGGDDPWERRRGTTSQAQGISRDPGRSSHRYGVNASGVRWLRLRLLVPMAWAKRVWAVPCLTVWAAAARDPQARGQRHQTLTEWARHRLLVVRRWVLGRDPHEAYDSQAWRCPDLPGDPSPILAWWVLRWRLEVTWHEARAQLGLETPRQWNAKAIARPTLALRGLGSLGTLRAGP